MPDPHPGFQPEYRRNSPSTLNLFVWMAVFHQGRDLKHVAVHGKIIGHVERARYPRVAGSLGHSEHADPTFTSASMSALPVVNVIMSVSAAIPILFLCRSALSTRTYPLVLNIFKPPLLAVCVKATSVFDNKTSSVTSSVPEMSTTPLVSVIISGSPFMPICSPVNRTPSTSTNPLELEIVKLPLVRVCQSRIRLREQKITSQRGRVGDLQFPGYRGIT